MSSRNNQGAKAYFEILKAMSPQKRLDTAFQLYHTAKRLKQDALRAQCPELSEEEIIKKVRDIFMYART